jgi:hypothetical protein
VTTKATYLIAVLLISGCTAFGTTPPDDERMARDVAGLEQAIPVLEELRVTGFTGESSCEYLIYERGTFIGDISGASCAAPTGTGFDPPAEVDHGRVEGTLDASGADNVWLYRVTYDDDGRMSGASFGLHGAPVYESYAYLYDPGGKEPKENFEGELEYTRITDDWWFVWSYFT